MEKNDIIDFKALERELQAALAADEKYKRENAAKFRAVEQRVASYEEFRGIVLASHLKPLEKKDRIRREMTAPWNCRCTPERASQDASTDFPQEKWCFQPETSAEFYRDWRRHLRSGPERYQALLELGGAKLGRLFRADVGFGLLGELLAALAEQVKPTDQLRVLDILHSLAGTGRFALNLSLLSPAERQSCRTLFQKLQAMSNSVPEGGIVGARPDGLLQELLGLYQVD